MAEAKKPSLFNTLFGFEFKPKEKAPESIPSFTPKDNDDGAVNVAAGSSYGTYVDLDGTVRSEAELVTKYREMSLQPECDSAVDEIINESISVDEEVIVSINLDDTKLSDKLKKLINEEFQTCIKLLNFNKQAYEVYRRWYIDGRLYYHVMIDTKKPEEGIKEIRYIDPRKIRKVREIQKKKIESGSGPNGLGDASITKTINEYYIYSDKGFNSGNRVIGQSATSGLKISKDSILHIVSGLTDNAGSMVLSYLHKSIKALNQLRTLEDALVIYRLARAPERRIWYIDVGNLPKIKAEQYVRDIMVKHKNKLVYDANDGTVKDDRKYLTMLEDFWLPRREGGRGTEVSTLPGGCFSMDTKVSLLDGRELSIRDIEIELATGKELWTYSCDQYTGEIKPGLISWAGMTQKSAKVMKLTLDNGKSIICTPDHKFPLYSQGFVEAKDFKIGESLIPLYRDKKFLGKNKKNDYERVFDNKSKKWIYTHRMVKNNLSLPTELYEKDYGDGYVVHHKDVNRFNNNPTNLCIMSYKDHINYHKSIGFNENIIKKGVKDFGYKNWLDFRKKESIHNHRIIDIEYLEEPIEVGTLTIDQDELVHNHHTFALSCGVFTKNSTLGQMDDVLYFQKKFLQCLNVPVSRLNSDALFSIGRATEITRDELKFARFVVRLRSRFSSLFSKMLEKQLVLKGIMKIEEFNQIASDIKYNYSKDNYFTELKNSEIAEARINLARNFQDMTGKYYPHSWVRKNILKQTDDQINDFDKQINAENEKGDPRWFNPMIAQNEQMIQAQSMEQNQMAQGILPGGSESTVGEQPSGASSSERPTNVRPPLSAGSDNQSNNIDTGSSSSDTSDDELKQKIEQIRQAKIIVDQMKKKKGNRSMQDEAKYKSAVQIIAKNKDLLVRSGLPQN